MSKTQYTPAQKSDITYWNEKTGQYETVGVSGGRVPKDKRFKGLRKWWSDYGAYPLLAIGIASAIFAIVFGIGTLMGWDNNTYRGPVASRVNAIISVKDYHAETWNGSEHTNYVFIGNLVGRFVITMQGNQQPIEKGDKVILALNQTGHILTFKDITALSSYCADNSDCDY